MAFSLAQDFELLLFCPLQSAYYWIKIHSHWINELRKFRFPHQQLAFEELKRTIRQIEERIATLDQAIEDAVKDWRFGALVDALRSLRGVRH